MKKIYISGKISGLPVDDVVAKFFKAKEDLERQGYKVVLPLGKEIPYWASWETHITFDIILLLGCDAVYMLSDWEQSRGVTLERNIAESTGKEIIYQDAPVYLEIKKAIYEATGIAFYEIMNSGRNYIFVFARMIFSRLCRDKGATVESIAKQINRNHSTVIYYLRKYSDYYQFTHEFKDLADRVKKHIDKLK